MPTLEEAKDWMDLNTDIYQYSRYRAFVIEYPGLGVSGEDSLVTELSALSVRLDEAVITGRMWLLQDNASFVDEINRLVSAATDYYNHTQTQPFEFGDLIAIGPQVLPSDPCLFAQRVPYTIISQGLRTLVIP